MNKLYVVLEDYTNAFGGLYDDIKKARQAARDIGGRVYHYNFTNVTYDEFTGEINACKYR